MEKISQEMDFMLRLRKMDTMKVTVRDIILLWAIARQPGMMGRELALKLGYNSRANVQDSILRLISFGFIEDRRVKINNKTPNDLHVLPLGEQVLHDIAIKEMIA